MPEGSQPKPHNVAWTEARRGWGKYECASCKSLFGPKEVDKDHIEPIIDPETLSQDMNQFMVRALGPIQILCKPCHKKKSAKEAAIRAKTRKRLQNA